ncbi:MAG: hypothetical protein Q8N82_07180 [Deltaproteobacteria bacterium]|nr:hypothetical protein [Deltaproteobacteria bacterium]
MRWGLEAARSDRAYGAPWRGRKSNPKVRGRACPGHDPGNRNQIRSACGGRDELASAAGGKSSIREWVCFINLAFTHGKLCVLPREVSHGAPGSPPTADENWLRVEQPNRRGT